MTLQSKSICDGLTLSYINTAQFKVGALTFTVCIPASPRNALLGLLLCGVMHRGTESKPSFSTIYRHLSMLYGADINIQCTRQASSLCFTVSADMLDERYSLDSTDILGGVADTVADILFNSIKKDGIFPESTVDAEKSILRDSLSAEKNNGAAYALLRLKELMARDTDSATLEELLGSLDGVSSEELSDFHLLLLRSPMSIMYVGSQDADCVAEKLYRAFSPFKAAAVGEPPVLSPRCALVFERVCEDKSAAQSQLTMGFRTGTCLGERNFAAAQLLNEIFGAPPASKLFLGVRERLGLCYSCYSSLSSLTGNLHVSAGIDIKNARLAESEILRCLDEIKRGAISDTEFVAAQKSLAYGYTQLNDSPHSLSRFYTLRTLFGVDGTPGSELEAIRRTTKEDVTELAGGVVYDTAFLLRGTLGSEVGEE